MTQQTSIRDLTQRSKNMSVNQMGGSSVQQFFEANRKAIESALPKHMSAERMMKVALHALRTTPTLKECNTASLMGAIVEASSLGLEPNTVMGHAYLVPFWNGRENRKDVQLIPGYRGLIDLARRSGQIESIYAHEVCEHDHFRLHLGTDGNIEHEPGLSDRGEIIGVYAVAKFRDGGYQFEFMPREKVDRIRDGSQGYQNAIKRKKDHPWINHYEQMARKTAIRRLAKYLPLSVEFATAAALDDLAQGDKPQGLENVLDGDFTAVDRAALSEEADAGDEEPGEPEPITNPDPDAQPNTDPQHESADAYIASMEKAESLESLDEVMAYAGDVLTGTEKARATKAFNRNKQRLESGGEQIQF